MASRRSNKRKQRNRGRFGVLYKLLSLIIILVVVAAGCVVFFRVGEITVSGVSRYTAQDIIDASGVEKGDNLFLVGGSRFAHLCSTPLSLSDLKQYPLAGLSGSTMSYRFYEDFFAAHGLSLHYDIEMANADLLLPVARHNLGLAFVPEKLVEDSLEQGKLFSIPLKEEIPLRHVCLVRDPGRPLGAATRCLLELLMKERSPQN